MQNPEIATLLGQTDLYLIDQILKGRYKRGDILLDAGCGWGRNLHWFLHSGFDIYGVDSDGTAIEVLKQTYRTTLPEQFRIERVEQLSFQSHFFDGIISSAVLHFATSTAHFFEMLDELYRVLKPGGNLFIRMASDIGIENRVQPLSDGVYAIPDGSTRFLLTRELLNQVMQRYAFSFLEDFKTVNVNDVRSMSTLVLQKT